MQKYKFNPDFSFEAYQFNNQDAQCIHNIHTMLKLAGINHNFWGSFDSSFENEDVGIVSLWVSPDGKNKSLIQEGNVKNGWYVGVLNGKPLLIDPEVFEAISKPFTVKPEHPAQ